MLTELQAEEICRREITFRTSRSGGKGGQNVNKVESRVELTFDFKHSLVLNVEQKQMLATSLGQDTIRITAESDRSQFRNKVIAREKLTLLLQRLLRKKKKRKPTAPSRAAKEKKIKSKKRQSEKKALRRLKPDA